MSGIRKLIELLQPTTEPLPTVDRIECGLLAWMALKAVSRPENEPTCAVQRIMGTKLVLDVDSDPGQWVAISRDDVELGRGNLLDRYYTVESAASTHLPDPKDGRFCSRCERMIKSSYGLTASGASPCEGQRAECCGHFMQAMRIAD